MYQMFIGHAWVIPAAAAFLEKPKEEIQKAWDDSIKKKKGCVITVAGDLPPYKKCPVCGVMLRLEAVECPVCGQDEPA